MGNVNAIEHKRQIRCAGFTLVEVLLALSVFALAGLALLSTADTHFTHLSNIEQRMYADWVASDQLVDVKLDHQWPPKNNQKGKVELAGHEWHWRQQVIKTTDDDMRAVVIEVRLSAKDEQALSSIMTYVSRGTSK